MRYFVLLVIAFVVANTSYAQVRISGTVNHNGKPADKVIIEVYEAGVKISSLAATKRGQYLMDLPFDREYVLVFKKSMMIPVRIDVNTTLSDRNKEFLEVDVPLNMELFCYFDGLEITPYDQSIGEIKQNGIGQNTFGFIPDAANVEAMKVVNEGSKQRLKNGEQPVEVPTGSAVAFTGTQPAKKAPENVADDKVRLEEERADRTAGRFQQVENSQLEQANLKREQVQVEAETSVAKRTVQEDHAVIEKTNRHDYAMEQQRNQDFIADARVARHDDMISSLEYTASNASLTAENKATTLVPVPLTKEVENYLFSSVERLIVNEQGIQNQYEKVTYDMYVIELVYCYKNKEEISEESYAAIAQLFK
ncbi:MAG: hypothetical protein R2813_13795 [Flavobacteriales bacterium]